MSDHDGMNHEGSVSSDNQVPRDERWVDLLRSRIFRIAVTAVVLGAGLLLARKFGVGGSILPGAAVAVFMVGGHALMHSGHGTHGRPGSRSTHEQHGGCGGSRHSHSSPGGFGEDRP